MLCVCVYIYKPIHGELGVFQIVTGSLIDQSKTNQTCQWTQNEFIYQVHQPHANPHWRHMAYIIYNKFVLKHPHLWRSFSLHFIHLSRSSTPNWIAQIHNFKVDYKFGGSSPKMLGPPHSKFFKQILTKKAASGNTDPIAMLLFRAANFGANGSRIGLIGAHDLAQADHTKQVCNNWFSNCPLDMWQCCIQAGCDTGWQFFSALGTPRCLHKVCIHTCAPWNWSKIDLSQDAYGQT